MKKFTPLETIEQPVKRKRFLTGFIVAIIVSVIISLGWFELNAQISLDERVFMIKEKIRLKGIPKDSNGLRLWIPYPVSDAFQKISNFKIEATHETRLIADKDYENKIIYLKIKQGASIEDQPEIILSFKALRKELKGFDNPIATRKNL